MLTVEKPGAGHAGINQSKRRTAKAAFGRKAPDIPVRAAAARTMVHFAATIDDMEPPRCGIEMKGALVALGGVQHLPCSSSSFPIKKQSCDEAFYRLGELNIW